jgi:uncharacterized membrane protein HdeD (DUF308 family)
VTSNVGTRDPVRETIRTGARETSAFSWTYLLIGVLWVLYGAFVLSYRAGSVAAVASFVGVAFILGGSAELAVASRAGSWRWLVIVPGIAGIAAGVGTFAWPGITVYVVSVLVAWYLIVFGVIHIVSALANAKLPMWWTGLLLGIAELVLGVWAVHSWQASVLTLMTLVGVWAIFRGVNEISAAFLLRDVGKRMKALAAR